MWNHLKLVLEKTFEEEEEEVQVVTEQVETNLLLLQPIMWTDL